MFSTRHRFLIGITALGILLLVGYYSVPEPKDRQLSSAEQGRGLKHALEAARASIKQLEEAAAAAPTATNASLTQKVTIGTDRFAYIFYATNDNYACSALANIRRMEQLLYTAIAIHVLATEDVSEDFLQAIGATGAVLHIQSPPPMPGNAMHYYKDFLLKLRASEMHRLSAGLTRVLALDADQLVMNNMDHLFSDLPDVDLAAPRAYWLRKDWLSSTFMLINLSDRLWATIEKAMQN